MPSGTDPLIVQRAAREFAKAELGEHRYVMVLHDHQANPHVHLSVRAESKHGKRLNPRKADLQWWRETFAEKLRGWGIDAEASRQRTRGQVRHYEPLWRIKAGEEGRLKTPLRPAKSRAGIDKDQGAVVEAWSRIVQGLCRSDTPTTGLWPSTSLNLSRARSRSIPSDCSWCGQSCRRAFEPSIGH
ncbi:MAG: hypothetical protein ABI330_18150 [Caldimonas sp.]